MQRSIPILWGLVIVLLIFNLLLLDALNLARLTAIETLSKIETTLDSLSNEVIVYNIEVNQAVPVRVDVPFNRTMEIPLNTVIPVDQMLSVPFQTPAGEVMLEVPVKTDFPIDVVVPVDFNETITVDTVVQLNTTLPVEIDIAQTPLAGYLKQAKLDIARLRSRLALQGTAAAVGEIGVGSASDGESGVGPVPATAGDSQSQALSLESGAESATSDASQYTAIDLTPSSDGAAAQLDLGLCTHAYWPLWPGTSWTYNSPDTSYTQRVDDASDNQVFLSTRYEGQDIRFSLVCSQEGLGGNYLGDMRRISELGDLSFNNPRGMFLPRPETMEAIGTTWTQEFDVTGTVQAHRGDSLVEGEISRGRAVAVYTPTRFEIVETPSGLQTALRIEQRLNLTLNINFDLEGQTIPATETVNLTTVYWFVRGVGPVKVYWQGGTIQQGVELDRTSVNEQSSVPALAEDRLVFVCVLLGEQSLECARKDGVSQSDLTAPPESELEVRIFAFPDSIISDDDTRVVETGAGEPPGKPAGDGDSGRSDLLAYAAAVGSLGQQLSEAAKAFWEAAQKFQNGQLTLDAFRGEFLAFASRVRGLVREINQLSPPPKAETVHQKLTGGLSKCDQAVDLMDQWFDTPDSGIKEAAALLVVECVEDVTAASEELMTLIGGD